MTDKKIRHQEKNSDRNIISREKIHNTYDKDIKDEYVTTLFKKERQELEQKILNLENEIKTLKNKDKNNIEISRKEYYLNQLKMSHNYENEANIWVKNEINRYCKIFIVIEILIFLLISVLSFKNKMDLTQTLFTLSLSNTFVTALLINLLEYSVLINEDNKIRFKYVNDNHYKMLKAKSSAILVYIILGISLTVFIIKLSF
ncbi:hypothetical protein [Macrococcoides caseolyticum]|uniref:hypothetical protein n=1 Tax=Macrococcoides caseolyticum TaxID=69966 RepID=UPI0030EDD564